MPSCLAQRNWCMHTPRQTRLCRQGRALQPTKRLNVRRKELNELHGTRSVTPVRSQWLQPLTAQSLRKKGGGFLQRVIPENGMRRSATPDVNMTLTMGRSASSNPFVGGFTEQELQKRELLFEVLRGNTKMFVDSGPRQA